MANPYSPPNGLNQSTDYVIPDAGGNAGGTSGDAGYMKRGKGTGGGYTVTGAADKSLNQVFETHQDGETFSADPIEIVAAGVTDGGLTKAQGYVHQPNVWKSFSALAITSEADVWVPTNGKRFRLLGFVITQGTLTGDIALKDGTGLATILTVPATVVGQALPFDLGGIGILSGAINRHLTATGTATETISGFVFGVEE